MGIPYLEALKSYQVIAERPLIHYSVDGLLEKYHPDFYSKACAPLVLGANKGEICQIQIAEIIQASSRANNAVLENTKIIETEVLVIGGGGAGCTALLSAIEQGAKVLLATKLGLGDSNTVMAEGGIQVSVDHTDTPQQHFNDTVKSGQIPVDKELVAKMVLDGPEVIDWLLKKGMHFDVDAQGNLLTRKAGGTSTPRVVSYKDYTGLEMMRVLRDCVRNCDAIVMNNSAAVELLADENGQCSGAVLYCHSQKQYKLIKAKSVILATGGIGRLHLNGFPTSNHFGATGDGLVLAYRLGVKLRDLDSFQYHPSGLAYPQHVSGTLITEGVRSAGAYLINGKGERFINELLARDVVSSAILRECIEGRGVGGDDGEKGVWLDTPGLEIRKPGIIASKFPKLLRLGEKIGIDPRQQPMLIYPTLHYQNGGVVINENGETNIPGLYCIGELTGGIHGRNRLMGNALLDIISFGRSAGIHAAKNTGCKYRNITLNHVEKWEREREIAGLTRGKLSPVLFPEYVRFDKKFEEP